jgi:hypothetical protein
VLNARRAEALPLQAPPGGPVFRCAAPRLLAARRPNARPLAARRSNAHPPQALSDEKTTAAAAAAAAASGGVFLSLYGGVSHVAQEACKLGLDSIVVDFDHDPRNDLCKPAVQRETLEAVKNKLVQVVGVELVCSSWSLARRAPQGSSMPSAVRDSNKYIFGLPNLTGKDALTVKAGNSQYRHAMKLIKLCLEHGVRGYLENPQTSRIFRTPGIQRLIRLGLAFPVTCHFCQYHTQWRKATTFLIWGVEPQSVVLKKCCMKGGRCSASGKRHLELTGFDKGKFRTSAAQAYPRALAQDLMGQLLKAPAYKPPCKAHVVT